MEAMSIRLHVIYAYFVGQIIFRFNTAVSAITIFDNDDPQQKLVNISSQEDLTRRSILQTVAKILFNFDMGDFRQNLSGSSDFRPDIFIMEPSLQTTMN
jgi:hypothetical protein